MLFDCHNMIFLAEVEYFEFGVNIALVDSLFFIHLLWFLPHYVFQNRKCIVTGILIH